MKLKVLPLSLSAIEETFLLLSITDVAMQHWRIIGRWNHSSFKCFWHFALKTESGASLDKASSLLNVVTIFITFFLEPPPFSSSLSGSSEADTACVELLEHKSLWWFFFGKSRTCADNSDLVCHDRLKWGKQHKFYGVWQCSLFVEWTCLKKYCRRRDISWLDPFFQRECRNRECI